MEFYTDKPEFEGELRDIVRMFAPYFDDDIDIKVFLKSFEPVIAAVINESVRLDLFPDQNDFAALSGDKRLMRLYKVALYRALSKYCGISLPWGSLTGIRPSRLMYKYLENGLDLPAAKAKLIHEYDVSPQKAMLLTQIIKAQMGYIYNDEGYVNLYIHIPFCPSRCKYCSFVSLESGKHQLLMDRYIQLLLHEIRATKELITGKRILSVYIGGGTPTVLSESALQSLIDAVDIRNVEFTVEAGRPETITSGRLDILRRGGVTRLSVNPQTFCDKTLNAIGRNHTANDVIDAFKLARSYGFDINMDLIAGLENETLEDFEYTLNKTLELVPQNITVHTLSHKNGSQYMQSNHAFNCYTQQMVEAAHTVLPQSGYVPYYLYRQKNMAASLENTGYCLSGKQSVNNITVMEECVSVYACGAGAISKTVENGRIERYANLRDVKLYVDEYDKRLEMKKEFLKVR